LEKCFCSEGPSEKKGGSEQKTKKRQKGGKEPVQVILADASGTNLGGRTEGKKCLRGKVTGRWEGIPLGVENLREKSRQRRSVGGENLWRGK